MKTRQELILEFMLALVGGGGGCFGVLSAF
jgi:hypothetical protein